MLPWQWAYRKGPSPRLAWGLPGILNHTLELPFSFSKEKRAWGWFRASLQTGCQKYGLSRRPAPWAPGGALLRVPPALQKTRAGSLLPSSQVCVEGTPSSPKDQTHSSLSFHCWSISVHYKRRTGRPGLLWSMGSPRVRYNWVSEQAIQWNSILVKDINASKKPRVGVGDGGGWRKGGTALEEAREPPGWWQRARCFYGGDGFMEAHLV